MTCKFRHIGIVVNDISRYESFLNKIGYDLFYDEIEGGLDMRINFQYVIDFLDLIENSDFGKIKTITFISSIAALVDVGARIAYRISKNAINALTPILAKKWAPHIRVNTICPGNILHESSV